MINLNRTPKKRKNDKWFRKQKRKQQLLDRKNAIWDFLSCPAPSNPDTIAYDLWDASVDRAFIELCYIDDELNELRVALKRG